MFSPVNQDELLAPAPAPALCVQFLWPPTTRSVHMMMEQVCLRLSCASVSCVCVVCVMCVCVCVRASAHAWILPTRADLRAR